MISRATFLTLLVLASQGCTRNEPAVEGGFDRLGAAEVYVKKGVSYMENGMLDIAMSDLKHALELNPSSADAHNAIAVLYERLGEPQKARESYQRSLDLNASDTSLKNNFARFLCEHGDFKTAMRYFGEVTADRLRQSPWIASTNAGICARKEAKLAEAERYLRDALQQNPTFPPALLEMAKLSWDNRQPMSARAFLQRFQEVGQMTADALWLGIQTEAALGSQDTAQRYLELLRGEYPDAPETREAQRRFGAD